MSVDALIRRAIHERRLVEFMYHGAPRAAEPHDYGRMQSRVRLLSFQVRGSSRGSLPGWRLFDVAEIKELRVLGETFGGSRGTQHRTHKHWDEVFCRVG